MALSEEGFTTLTFDFRGNGQPGGYLDANRLVYDVQVTVKFLVTWGYEKIIYMGASLGGTACMKAATDIAGLA